MTLKEWLEQEPFTLTMSSGFFSFYAHCGMLSVLEEQDLLPKRITGSSAGALIGASWAAGLSSQDILDLLKDLKKSDFWDPGFGLGLLKGQKFRQMLRDALPITRLEESRVPVSFSAYDWKQKQVVSLQTGDVMDSIYASCAVPFLFQPIIINHRSLIDGGVKDRPGLDAVKEGERTFYHHILSRSPWRRKNDPALSVPSRENMVSLSIEGLLRSGPNKLDVGIKAYTQARMATQAALQEALDNNDHVCLSAEPYLK